MYYIRVVSVESVREKADRQYPLLLSIRMSTNQCWYNAWILPQCWEDAFISAILRQYFGYRWSYNMGVQRVYRTVIGAGLFTELSTELSAGTI